MLTLWRVVNEIIISYRNVGLFLVSCIDADKMPPSRIPGAAVENVRKIAGKGVSISPSLELDFIL